MNQQRLHNTTTNIYGAYVEDTDFVESWYPLCLSSELKPGKVLRVEAFGTTLAVFRTEDGDPGVLYAQCCHMGSDLSRGKVVNRCLQCPLHHWEFDVHGQCKNIPCQKDIPGNIEQPSLHTTEYMGLVFCYLGDEPSYKLESVADQQKVLHMAGFWREFNAGYKVLGINAFDRQHVLTVHGREIVDNQFIIEYKNKYCISVSSRFRVARTSWYTLVMKFLGYEEASIQVDCWGGNILLMSHPQTRNSALICSVPTGKDRSRLFIVGMTETRPMPHWLQRLRLAISTRMILFFLNDDFVALDNCRLNPRNLLDVYDDAASQWLAYWDKLPKTKAPGFSSGTA